VCRDAHLPRPCRAEGGRTTAMTMPFGYVGIEHVFIRFTAPHARAPRGRRGHPVWSSHAKTHFNLSPPSPPNTRSRACMHRRKDTNSTRRSNSSQQPRSELALLCIMPVQLLFRRARLPTSDDNFCRDHLGSVWVRGGRLPPFSLTPQCAIAHTTPLSAFCVYYFDNAYSGCSSCCPR
jgi:hypothetical protein